MPMAAPAGSAPHPVNIGSALRRNSLVSDPEDLVLLREKLTRIAVAADGADRQPPSGRYGDLAAIPRGPVFNASFRERPATPPSSPQPRDVLRKQLRLKKQAAAARRRLGSSTAAGSEEDEDEHGFDLCMSVDEVEITRLELDGEGGDAGRRIRADSTPSPRVRLSIPSHLRASSAFSVLAKCPEGIRKRKSVHVDEAHVAAAVGPGSHMLKKTSSQINMLSHGGDSVDALGTRLFKSLSTSALFAAPIGGGSGGGGGGDSADHEMEDAWPDPEPPESPSPEPAK